MVLFHKSVEKFLKNEIVINIIDYKDYEIIFAILPFGGQTVNER